jgi:predicted esterase
VRAPGAYLEAGSAPLRAQRVPEGDPKLRWPLIVFLHGSGERGTDPLQLVDEPLPKTLATTTSFPAVVLSPQAPATYYSWSDLIEPVDALVQQIETRYRIDPRRVYLTGLSMGGFGTWHYALQHPTHFAALVPIAGGYVQGSRAIPPNICVLRRTPIWAFNGTADTIVYPYQPEILVQALRACGSAGPCLLTQARATGVVWAASWPCGQDFQPMPPTARLAPRGERRGVTGFDCGPVPYRYGVTHTALDRIGIHCESCSAFGAAPRWTRASCRRGQPSA